MTREIAFTLSATGGYYDDEVNDDEIYVTELSCIELEDRRPTGRRFHCYINPPVDISEPASEESGLTNEFLNNHPTFANAADDILSFIGRSNFVVYVPEFEKTHLVKEFERIGVSSISRRSFFDVHNAAGRLIGLPSNRRGIDQVSETLGIQSSASASSFDFLENVVAIYQKLAEFEIASDPPPSPEQGAGPKFELDDEGYIAFAKANRSDVAGNDFDALEALYPTLRELAADLSERLSAGNAPYAKLRDRLFDYFRLLPEDLGSVRFALLFGAGVRLENSLRSARREIEYGELPRFDEGLDEALSSLLQIHGAFILSTGEGAKLISLEERYNRTPEQERDLQDAAIILGEKLRIRTDIIRPEAAELISTSAQDAQANETSIRVKTFSTSVASNAGVVMLAGAAIAAIPLVGNAVFGPVGGLSGGALALIGAEGLKKSKPFLITAKIITQGIDSISESDLKNVVSVRSKQLYPLLKFVLNNELTLRKIAGNSRQLSWLNQILDWLSANRHHIK